ncbi:MAG: hypothetical protein OWQ59_12320 [Alicyclobacillaceae bacterium]|nr:hypothetical protein [Alicyclobacillaceae bacterium]
MPTSSSQNVANARVQRPFVGRVAEIQTFRKWVQASEPPTQMWTVSGMGGIGKSSLLAEFIKMARGHDQVAIRLDGRLSSPSPTGFLEYLRTSLDMELGPNRPHGFAQLPLLLRGRKFVIAIDNFEALRAMETWLMEDFFSRLPDVNVLFVSASRQHISHIWESHDYWQERLQVMPLGHLSQADMQQYFLRHKHILPTQVDPLIHLTGGHPLSLQLAVEAVHSGLKGDALLQFVAAKVSGHLLQDLVDESLHTAVDILTILSSTNHDVLRDLLGPTFTQKKYHQLMDISFVVGTPSLLALHDVARSHLLFDFRSRQPQRLARLRFRLHDYLQRKLLSARPEVKMLYARSLLTLALDAFEYHSDYADVTVDPLKYEVVSARRDDLPRLHAILDDWCTYSVDPGEEQAYHDFLEELFLSFPECFRVIRNELGQVVAMFISVLLHEGTAPLVLRHFATEVRECFPGENVACPLEEAHCFLAVLGAFAFDAVDYSGAEMIGALAKDTLSVSGQGIRFALVVTHPALKELLTRLGFSRRETVSRECDTTEYTAEVFELDLREDGFVRWTRRLLEAAQSAAKMGGPVAVDVSLLREALSVARSPKKLYATELAKGLELDGDTLYDWFQRSLSEKVPPAPLTVSSQSLLRVLYLECGGNANKAYPLCNVSRPTFYRYLSVALEQLGEALLSFVSL